MALDALKVKLIVSGLFALLLLGVLIAIPLFQDKDDRAPPMIVFVLLASAVGRAIEVTSRPEKESITKVEGGMEPYVNLAWEVLLSMALANIVYLMFQGGIIQGSLFPRFAADNEPYTNVIDYMKNVKPASNMDAGKAIFWSFIAGYSAKFAPRLLHRAAENGEEESSTKQR